MKIRFLITAMLVTSLAMLIAACGGGGDSDDGGPPEIRTQKGLAVAAASENIGRVTEDGAESDTTADLRAPAGGITAEADALTRVTSEPYFPYPNFAAQQGTDGLSVIGYGSATAAADSAVIEFYFSRNSDGVSPGVPETRSSDSSGSGSAGSAGEPGIEEDAVSLQEVGQITEADLQPVIDALVGAGVARDDIEFIGQAYYDIYYASATLRATVRNIGNVDGAVEAARNAAGGIPNTRLESTNVSYTLQDCAALESAAMGAAVEDAGERSQALAAVLGVGIGSITGASNYSYSPYGGTPCATGYFGPYPLDGVAYESGQASDVTVFAQVGVTYAIQ